MKKLLGVMVSVILLILAVNSSAFGAVNADKVNIQVANANSQIQNLIDAAVKSGDYLLSEYNQNIAQNPNDVIELTNNFNHEIDKLVNNLLDNTNAISSRTIAALAKQGVTVVCDWVPVTIGGRNILVDPMRVIGI